MGFGGREVKDQRGAGSVSGSGCGRVGLDYRAVRLYCTGPSHGTGALPVPLGRCWALRPSVCHGSRMAGVIALFWLATPLAL